MIKIFLLAFASGCCSILYSQNRSLVLIKRQKTVQRFWTQSRITFQRRDGEWFSGIITKITADSFYMTRESIHHNLMGTDTVHFSGYYFGLKDIFALPTRKEIVNNINGRIDVILGHEKFVWVRNGFIFQVVGAGYATLNIVNGWIQKEPPFAKSNLPRLGIAAATLLIGEMLHLKFDPYIHIGKKYSLEIRQF